MSSDLIVYLVLSFGVFILAYANMGKRNVGRLSWALLVIIALIGVAWLVLQ